MIQSVTTNTTTFEPRVQREVERTMAYQSMQKSQSHWAQFKNDSTSDTARDGVSLTISGVARNKVSLNPSGNDSTTTAQAEVVNASSEAVAGNLSVLMDRIRSLSLESGKDSISDHQRNQMYQEMRKLLEEAEHINKGSKSSLQGFVKDPVRAMNVQRAHVAFQAQKNSASNAQVVTSRPVIETSVVAHLQGGQVLSLSQNR